MAGTESRCFSQGTLSDLLEFGLTVEITTTERCSR